MVEPRYVDGARLRTRTVVLAAAVLALPGCSARKDHDRRSVVVVPGDAAATPIRVPTTAAGESTIPRVEGLPAIASAAPAAALHKTFADPPLPPELRDDGGLAPLPPRPAPSAMATNLHPTFERAAREERP